MWKNRGIENGYKNDDDVRFKKSNGYLLRYIRRKKVV